MFALNNKQHITNFCLEIKQYGEPKNVEDYQFVIKYYEGWAECCRRMVEELPNLRNIAISVVVPRPTMPGECRLSLDEDWVLPVLQFQYSPSLQSASITLLLDNGDHGATIDTCTAFSEVLRRMIFGWKSRDALEAIHDFRGQPRKDRCTTKKSWQMLAMANAIELNDENSETKQKDN